MSVGLREFIKQTLSDVLSGVADAQAVPSLGKYVAPALTHQRVPAEAVHRNGGPVTSINFGVAITVESTDRKLLSAKLHSTGRLPRGGLPVVVLT
jgi:hypothetical protein